MEKKITIESLARMVEKGFDETAKEESVNRQFHEVNERLDRIEKIILTEHERRLDIVEQNIKSSKDQMLLK